MINERIDKLKDIIDETETDIKNIQFVVKDLKKIELNRIEDKCMLNACIEKLESEISFLEDIKENDEAILNTL